ncbi:hypothetical protein [Pseudonocardia sp. NPDC049635]|uniref:hypothetical protein n=1 Tax=Pseudonocardia sp. NPDC049635 TaxID=3155506 RepID=UPI0033ED08D2
MGWPWKHNSRVTSTIEIIIKPDGVDVEIEDSRDARKAMRLAYQAEQILEAWRAVDEAEAEYERDQWNAAATSDQVFNAGMDHLRTMAADGHLGAKMILDPWTEDQRILVDKIRDGM